MDNKAQASKQDNTPPLRNARGLTLEEEGKAFFELSFTLLGNDLEKTIAVMKSGFEGADPTDHEVLVAKAAYEYGLKVREEGFSEKLSLPDIARTIAGVDFDVVSELDALNAVEQATKGSIFDTSEGDDSSYTSTEMAYREKLLIPLLDGIDCLPFRGKEKDEFIMNLIGTLIAKAECDVKTEAVIADHGLGTPFMSMVTPLRGSPRTITTTMCYTAPDEEEG